MCDNPMCSCASCSCDVCTCGSARLGELERRVMDVLWAVGGDMSGREVAERFPDNAYTTVATVLDRLVNKGLVRRGRAGRTIRFDAVGSPGAHAAAQMHQALAAGQVTEATLVHFARTLSADEAAILRAVLDDAAVPASGSGT